MESFDPTISKEAYSLAARLIEEFDKMEVIVQGYVYVALELFPTLSNLWLQFVQYIVLHWSITFRGCKISTVKHAYNEVARTEDLASL